MKNKYRIVTDYYCGYEVQVRFWYFPFCWFQFKESNTHTSVKDAEVFFCKRLIKSEFVKELFEEQCE
jgi:hypothetical protein